MKSNASTRIIDEAKEVFDKLPDDLQSEIIEYLDQGTNLVLSTKFSILIAYLEFEGINGHEKDIVDIFKSMM